MKKAIVVTVWMTILLLFSAAMAETVYIVKKGDCLSVIGKHLNVNWREIAKANQIKNPWIIHPKQKLIIPKLEKSIVQKIKKWEKVGGNPYKGTWQWAINQMKLPSNIKKQVEENIRKNKFTWFNLTSGQVLDHLISGKNEVWGKTISSWNKTELFAAKDYGFNGYRVLYVLKCGNWANFQEKILPALVPTIRSIA